MNREMKRSLGKEAAEILQNQMKSTQIEVTNLDNDVNLLIEINMRDKVTSGPVLKDDLVSVGYSGFLHKEDGSLEEEPFEGGTAPYMIIDLEKEKNLMPEILGAIKNLSIEGRVTEVELTFPNFFSENLRGKKATFKVVLIAAWRKTPYMKMF